MVTRHVPENMKKWRYTVGSILGVRGRDRTWTVAFWVKAGMVRKRIIMVFRRHELRKTS